MCPFLEIDDAVAVCFKLALLVGAMALPFYLQRCLRGQNEKPIKTTPMHILLKRSQNHGH